MEKDGNQSPWEKNLEKELLYFINMCGEEDRKVFVRPRRKRTVPQYGRLICIAMAIGLRGAMLWLFARCDEKRIGPEEIFAYLESVAFATIETWVNEFIGAVANPLLKRAAGDIWSEKRKKLCEGTFRVRDLL